MALLPVFMMDWRAEVHFLNGCPKGWDTAGTLVADLAGSVRGFAFCRLSRLERERLLVLPRGRTRLLNPSHPATLWGLRNCSAGVFFLKVVWSLTLFHGVNSILAEIALWPSPLLLAIKRHHYGNHLHGRITLGKAVCVVSSL